MRIKKILSKYSVIFSLLGFSCPAWAGTPIGVGPDRLTVAARPASLNEILSAPSPLQNFTPEAKRMVSSAAQFLLDARASAQLQDLAAQLSAQQAAQNETEALLEAQPELNARPLVSLKTIPTVNNRANDLPVLADTESETTVAVSGKNVAVGFNSSPDFVNFGIGLSGYSHSSDRGKTFTEVNGGLPQASFGGSPPLIPDGDPDLVVDASGNFYYSTLASDSSTGESWVLIYKSTDGGVTFVPLTGVHTGNTTDFLDKELIAVDNAAGLIYMTFTDFFGLGGQQIFCLSLTTAGAPTALVGLNNPATTAGSGTMPAVGPNGEVYVAWEQTAPIDAIVFVKSTNHGATFSSIATVSAVTPALNVLASIACGRPALRGGIRETDFPSIAVDTGAKSKFKGNVYVIWNDGGHGDADILFSRSTDGGGTWSTPIQVNKNKVGDGTDQFMPWVNVMPNGKIAALWYDRRSDPNNWHIDVSAGNSTNGGTSFSNFAPESFHFPVITNINPLLNVCYMGDYNQITNDGKNFFFTWGDNTNGDPDVVLRIK